MPDYGAALNDWLAQGPPPQQAGPDYTLMLQQYMTHQPEQPNPAKPYLDFARNFSEGGLHQALKGAGVETPEWTDRAARLVNSPAANAALGVMTPMKGGKAMDLLRDVGMKAAQPGIKASLPGPKNILDRAWDNYTKRMSESEMLSSEATWGTAQRLADEKGMPAGKAFARVVNDWHKRKGTGKTMTEDEANAHMGGEQGAAMLQDILRNRK